MTRLTVGSDTLAEYKGLVGSSFRDNFPVLDSRMDKSVRLAYRGGFTYANDKFKQQLLGSGQVFDVNSLYPSVMRFAELPYGMPKFVDEISDDKLFICSITFTAKLKEHGVPCIQVKKCLWYRPEEYLKEINEPVTMAVTSVDLKLYEDNYDMDIISIDNVIVFDSACGMFDDYVDKWMNVKEKSRGGVRHIAKLHLNSLYGKFATNTDVTSKVPVLEDGIVRLRTGELETRSPVYTPVGVFITAWARSTTIRAVMGNLDRFAYADTDSMHLLGDEPPAGIEVHDTHLGAWKCEMHFQAAVFVRAKQYSERDMEGRVHTHIAGLPAVVADTIVPEDLLTDHVWSGKLIPVRTSGGIVLKNTTFSFKAKD